MNILRGTFRLSFVVAGAVFAYGVWSALLIADDAGRRAHELWSTLRCAEKLTDQQLSSVTNEFGNFDLGKLGCSYRTFWANKQEVADARVQLDPGPARRAEERNWELRKTGYNTAAAFVGTNLLGLLALGLMYLARWVRDGFSR